MTKSITIDGCCARSYMQPSDKTTVEELLFDILVRRKLHGYVFFTNKDFARGLEKYNVKAKKIGPSTFFLNASLLPSDSWFLPWGKAKSYIEVQQQKLSVGDVFYFFNGSGWKKYLSPISFKGKVFSRTRFVKSQKNLSSSDLNMDKVQVDIRRTLNESTNECLTFEVITSPLGNMSEYPRSDESFSGSNIMYFQSKWSTTKTNLNIENRLYNSLLSFFVKDKEGKYIYSRYNEPLVAYCYINRGAVFDYPDGYFYTDDEIDAMAEKGKEKCV